MFAARLGITLADGQEAIFEMADDNQDAEARRRAEEERQRSLNYPQGQIIAGGASTITANEPTNLPHRPPSEWGTPSPQPNVRAVEYAQRGLPVEGEQNAFGFTGANTVINVPAGTPTIGIGDYIDRAGNSLGPTHSPAPQGTVGVQGRLSPQEEQFWAANQMGAVPHPVTGELIGLGSNESSRQARLDSITQPDQFTGPQIPSPNYVPVPERDPAVGARRAEIANEIAQKQNELRGASNQRIGRGQLSQAEIIRRDIAILQHVDSGLALHEHQQNQAIHEATHLNSAMQKEYDIRRDSTAAQIALSKLPSDDAEALKAITKIYFDHAHATEDPRTEAALISETRLRRERLAARQAAEAQGLIEVPTHFGQRGESVKYINPTVQDRKQADAELKAYGVQLPSITNPVNVAVGRIATQADVDSKKAKNVGDFIGDSGGNVVSIDTGKARNSHVPIDVYLKYGGQLSPADQKAQGQQGTAQSTAGQGYDIGVQYGNLIYQGGDPNLRSSWKPVQ